MRLNRINLAMLVASAFGFNQSLSVATNNLNDFSRVLRDTTPQTQNIKQNRVSQAKRRKYARQGRK